MLAKSVQAPHLNEICRTIAQNYLTSQSIKQT